MLNLRETSTAVPTTLNLKPMACFIVNLSSFRSPLLVIAALTSLFSAGCAIVSQDSPPLPPDMAQTVKGKPQPRWDALDESGQKALVSQLLPDYVKEKELWAQDLVRSYKHLELAQTPSTYCASIAVIRQESSFKADPNVPNLGRLVHAELKDRASSLLIPEFVLEKALNTKSPNGQTWQSRISALKTEKELNTLFEDMLSYLPFGQSFFEDFIPVRTAGPMQVSIAYAKQQIKQKPYPYEVQGSLRNEVFSRRGGIYFGTSILMDYPVSYTDPVHRFADFNAGRYASRNAAFQKAISAYTGQKLVLDGDLLAYLGSVVSPFPSNTEKALRSMGMALKLTKDEIRQDLLLEKQFEFYDTKTYNRTYELAQTKVGKLLTKAEIPNIRLQSPKITSQLTTSWFANKVKRRFNDCLRRVQ